ncbi:MAG: hypothetical protein WD555_01810 [Fulvivirga sp.]
MFSDLNATNFSGAIPFYEKQFEIILGKITACYKLMKDDVPSLPNDENKIRDVLLLNYLKDNQSRKKLDLLQWHFEREIQEDHSIGRTDLKVISANTFLIQEAYFLLECKRLDNINVTGSTGLNAKYIENGICRLVSKYYTSYHRVNGMIGFIVEKLDITNNIQNINELLINVFKESNTTNKIVQDNFLEGFPDHFYSIHKDTDDNSLKIYHLMFDLHENIQH